MTSTRCCRGGSSVLARSRGGRRRRGGPRRDRRPAAGRGRWSTSPASGKSEERPPPPCSWIAMSTTCWVTLGTITLIWLTSLSAFSGPPSSSFQAALSTSSRAWSMAIRASAMRSRLPPRLRIGLPNAVRDRPRLIASSRATSACPISRMQWCTRPGPSRPWAISKARPSPSRMFSFGTRTSSKLTSPWPDRLVVGRHRGEQPLDLHARGVPRHQHHRVPAVPVGVGVGEPHEDEDPAVRVADARWTTTCGR